MSLPSQYELKHTFASTGKQLIRRGLRSRLEVWQTQGRCGRPALEALLKSADKIPLLTLNTLRLISSPSISIKQLIFYNCGRCNARAEALGGLQPQKRRMGCVPSPSRQAIKIVPRSYHSHASIAPDHSSTSAKSIRHHSIHLF